MPTLGVAEVVGPLRDRSLRTVEVLFLARRQLLYDGLPAVSTLSLILRKEGLVDRARYRRRDAELRGPTAPYRPGAVANEQWTVDFKGYFRLGDRSMCRPLTVQDDATRYMLCVDGSGQQRRFGEFVHWINMDRSHQALVMRCPGGVYVASPTE